LTGVGARIAFRVDASGSIGLGHVKRCLSLGHALREQGADVHFVSRRLGVDVQAEVSADGFGFTWLPRPQSGEPADDLTPHAQWAGIDWQTDASQTVAALRATQIDWLVVDHYAFEARWHATVATALGCRLAAIDDLGDRLMDVSLLIDHNQAPDHRSKYAGRLSREATLLGGPSFAVLGPSYASAARYVFCGSVQSIGIFMGGVDAGNLSTTALHACRAAGFSGPVEVATTSSNPHLAALRFSIGQDVAATLSVDLPELSGFFARHDLQVGASGGATWERCCIGAPTLALIAADNQRQVLLPLVSSGAVQALTNAPPTTEQVAQAIKSLINDPGVRQRLSLRAMALVDGRGASRVAKEILFA
jgi:UDP-2,4-diacetamido-2,4,6-trideoxy-beta-L-altropyranose hydrolase